MSPWMRIAASAIVSVSLMTGIALAQTKSADCKPEKVEGQIVKIDWKEGEPQGKLTLKGNDGKTYEFNASKEALADKKVGDHLEVTKRVPANCG